MMKRIIAVLMKRDGMSKREATELVQSVKEDIEEALAVGDYDLVEDIMLGDLGLEMDYVFELI